MKLSCVDVFFAKVEDTLLYTCFRYRYMITLVCFCVLQDALVQSAQPYHFVATSLTLINTSRHRSLKWEFEVLRILSEAAERFEHINCARFTSQTLQTELEDNTISIMPYMTTTVGIMIAFCVLTSMMGDCVRSKPVVGLLGVVSAVLATGTAFGLLMYCGLPFIGINLAAPFLMLGEYRQRLGDGMVLNSVPLR